MRLPGWLYSQVLGGTSDGYRNEEGAQALTWGEGSVVAKGTAFPRIPAEGVQATWYQMRKKREFRSHVGRPHHPPGHLWDGALQPCRRCRVTGRKGLATQSGIRDLAHAWQLVRNEGHRVRQRGVRVRWTVSLGSALPRVASLLLGGITSFSFF